MHLQDKSMEVTLSKLGVLFGYVSPPRVGKDGRAVSCIIRPPTEKEKRAAMATSGTTATSTSTHTLPSTSTAKDSWVEKDMDSKWHLLTSDRSEQRRFFWKWGSCFMVWRLQKHGDTGQSCVLVMMKIYFCPRNICDGRAVTRCTELYSKILSPKLDRT